MGLALYFCTYPLYHGSTCYVLPYVLNVSNIITLNWLNCAMYSLLSLNCWTVVVSWMFHVSTSNVMIWDHRARDCISQAKYWVPMMSLSMAYNAPYLVWDDDLKNSHYHCHCIHCIESVDGIFNKWIWKYTRRCFLSCSNRYSMRCEGCSTSL